MQWESKERFAVRLRRRSGRKAPHERLGQFGTVP
jgi:hypothetical protein